MTCNTGLEGTEGQAYLVFCDRVRELTGGQLDITLFPAGAIVESSDIDEAIAEGMIEIAKNAPSYYAGKVPVGDFSLFGFGTDDFRQDFRFFYELGMDDLYREACEGQGMYVVDLLARGARYGGFIATNPISNLDDFSGSKHRAWGMFADLYQNFGASIVQVPGEEIYVSLTTGVLDSACWGDISDFYDLKVYEVAKYYVEMPTTTEWGVLLANPDDYNALPDDVKSALHTAARLTSYELANIDYYKNIIRKTEMEQVHGVTFMTFPQEDIQQMREWCWDYWRAKAQEDEYTGRAIVIYEDYLKEIGIL
jgi:TRAP-type mannitol/chloroaromatic compound transport system substrate-binding protein